jgi:hypothetical protein
VTSGTSTFAGGVTASNGLSVTSGTSTFADALIASNGLTVSAGSTALGSNLSVTGPIVSGGAIAAASYTGLPRKYWNAYTQGVTPTTNTTKYYKIATLGASGAGNTAGEVRISGQLGGYLNNQQATVDITIASRSTYGLVGTGYGFPSYAKTIVDIAVYWEGSTLVSSLYFVYIVANGSFPIWELSVEAPQLGPVLYEPSSTVVTSPTGTLITTSAISILMTSTDSSSTAITSYNSFYYNYNGSISPYWTLAGGSNTGSIACASIVVGVSNPSCTLDFDTNGANRQVGLATQTASWYGFGAQNSALQYLSGGSHTFYIGSTSTSLGTNELSVNASGSTYISDHTLPGTTGSYNIGSASSSFEFFSGSLSCAGLTSSSGLGVTSTATQTVNNITTVFAPSLETGQYLLNNFGTAQSINNYAFTGFNNTGGAGSSNNYAGFGVWGYALGSGTFNACANGNFGICTTTPACTRDVFGTGKLSGALTSGAVTCTNLTASGSLTLLVGSVAATAIANLEASKLTTGNFSVGTFGTTVCPNADVSQNLGSTSTRWGTLYANAYYGLPRKYRNSLAMGVQSIVGGTYFKVGTLTSLGDTNGGGGIRISGQLGGFNFQQTAMVDCTIVGRSSFYVKGYATGYVAGAKARCDIAVYLETDGTYSVYVYNPAQFSVWDLCVEGGYHVVLYEPSTAISTTTPTGVAIATSVLSVLTSVTELASGIATTSLNNFAYSNARTTFAPSWTLTGSSNSGSMAAGAILCSAFGISVPFANPKYIQYTNYQSFSSPASSNTNGDIYGYGQWGNGTMRMVITGVSTSDSTFNVAKPSGTNFAGFTDMFTVVSSNGNVGINNSSPAYQVDVFGTVHATGAVTFDGTLGAGTSTLGNLTCSNLNASGASTLGTVACTSVSTSAGQNNNILGNLSINDATDSGYTRGLHMWRSTDASWVQYIATAGASRFPLNGTTCSSLDGRLQHHLRVRMNTGDKSGVIWENGAEMCLMSLTADTGNLFVKGMYSASGTGGLMGTVLSSGRSLGSFLMTGTLTGNVNAPLNWSNIHSLAPLTNIFNGITTNYAIRSTGYINIQYAQQYTFYFNIQDDAAYVYSDGTLVLMQSSFTNLQASANYTFTTTGWKPIYIYHMQTSGGESLRLQWSTTGTGTITQQDIPASSLAYDQSEAKPTSLGGPLFYSDTSYNVGIANTNPFHTLDVTGTICATQGLKVNNNTNHLQSSYGSIGFISYSDGATYYQLATNSGDSAGGFNSLRPFQWNLGNGNVALANNQVTFAHSSGAMTCTSITASGALSCSNLTASGTVSLPSSSIASTTISGLVAVATSGSAADLTTGVLALAKVPNLPAMQITSGIRCGSLWIGEHQHDGNIDRGCHIDHQHGHHWEPSRHE